MMKKNQKKQHKVTSFFRNMKREWKGLTKPSGKELTVLTFRTVVISVFAALIISAIDVGFTQLLLFVSSMM